jgi:hypothetical protein
MMLYEIEKRAQALRSGSFTKPSSCLAEPVNRPQQLIGQHMFLERARRFADAPSPAPPMIPI